MLNYGINQQFYNANSSSYYEGTSAKVSLKNEELWKKFHSLGTEMIITKSGRRMFPSLHFQVTDLSPNALYCVFLEVAPSAQTRFKYSASCGWFPAGSQEAQSPNRIYLHPDSPARGDYWMSQPISFGRLKLTNTITPPAGQIVLSSMHKYQPRLVIAKTSDPRQLAWAPMSSFVFPETEFIAVTAYQNEKITKLKIDNNPFAKGFRETGQAKCKRKRYQKDDEDEKFTKVTKATEDLVDINKEDRLRSPDYLNETEENVSVCSSPSKSQSKPYHSPISISSSAESRRSSDYEDFRDDLPLSLSPGSKSSTSLDSPQHTTKTHTKPSNYNDCIEDRLFLSPSSSNSYTSFNPYPTTNPLFNYPYFYTHPAYSMHYWNPSFGSYYAPVPVRTVSGISGREDKVDRSKSRKLTDFSIRAITGCK